MKIGSSKEFKTEPSIHFFRKIKGISGAGRCRMRTVAKCVNWRCLGRHPFWCGDGGDGVGEGREMIIYIYVVVAYILE